MALIIKIKVNKNSFYCDEEDNLGHYVGHYECVKVFSTSLFQ